MQLLVGGVGAAGFAGFQVAFVGADRELVRERLAEAAGMAFEAVAPVRSIPSFRGQRNNPGLYYSATVGAHLEYESWLERDEAMALDFDPGVVGYAAQPFWLFWMDGVKQRSHAPDFFARLADRTGVVIDCRPAARIKPRDQAVFDTTAKACAEVGWSYRLVTGHDPVWLANVRWLAGYRAGRFRVEPVASMLRGLFARPRPLIEGAQAAGDPVAVLPVLYHLLWRRELVTDLEIRLEGWSLVTAGANR
ncbi:TnsA-like heteromeric transposase endonuclease subunit [Nocardia camponoti]|uniref:TnsA-like heteromeric transposase endonuclease subunit n=1 Tax=Nocardia camponoti TaxID=1616106 RepID=A0A917QA06_9NOCA|nr:TnsA-like heteromeric transposase endonuclease subunit [Nocardia camponoti]GGK35336.1 hypothetical protein GCM10011591_03740 [Nocardia camponoti]